MRRTSSVREYHSTRHALIMLVAASDVSAADWVVRRPDRRPARVGSAALRPPRAGVTSEDRRHLCARLHVEPRLRLGGTSLARVLRAPRALVPTDSVRQARHRPVRSRLAVRHTGDAHGGLAGGARCGWSVEGGRAGSARGVRDVRALRSHLSGAYAGAGALPPPRARPGHRRSRDAGTAECAP